jgi:hypothetical protein
MDISEWFYPLLKRQPSDPASEGLCTIHFPSHLTTKQVFVAVLIPMRWVTGLPLAPVTLGKSQEDQEYYIEINTAALLSLVDQIQQRSMMALPGMLEVSYVDELARSTALREKNAILALIAVLKLRIPIF